MKKLKQFLYDWGPGTLFLVPIAIYAASFNDFVVLCLPFIGCAYYGYKLAKEHFEQKQHSIKVVYELRSDTKRVFIIEKDEDEIVLETTELVYDQRFLTPFRNVISRK